MHTRLNLLPKHCGLIRNVSGCIFRHKKDIKIVVYSVHIAFVLCFRPNVRPKTRRDVDFLNGEYMEPKLKLYLWKDVLCDYTAGMMGALAESPEQALELLQKELAGYQVEWDLAQPYTVHETPIAFHVWGGG